MGFNFPNSPTPGQVYSPVGGYSYVFLDGVWRMVQPQSAVMEYIASPSVDMWAGFKTGPNKFVVNDKVDGTGTNVMALTEAGALSTAAGIVCTTVAATGAVSGASVTATGAVTAGSVATTGPLTAASVTSTGAVSGTSLEAINGNVTGNGAHIIISPSTGLVSSTVYLRPNGASNASAQATFFTDGNFSIGGPVGQKSSGTTWSNPSDARIKTVIGDYETGLTEILQLTPRRFTYKGNYTADAPDPVKEGEAAPYVASPHYTMATDGVEVAGFIAQEVETVMPAMVTQGPGYIDGVAVDDFRTLDQNNLILALVNSVKELSAKVQALEAKMVAT